MSMSNCAVERAFIGAGCNRVVYNVSWGASNLVAFGAHNAVAIFCPPALILTTLPAHKAAVNCTYWLPTSKFAFRAQQLWQHYLLSGDAHGTIILWEVSLTDKKWRQVLTVPQSHKKGVTCISGIMFSSTEAIFASTSSDGTVNIWEIILPVTAQVAQETTERPDSEVVDTLETVPEAVPVTFTEPPIEEQLAWHTLWPETHKLYGHGNELFSLCCDHEGKLVASSCKVMEHTRIKIKRSNDTEPDIISDLPKDVIHEIWERLPLRDAARMCVLSHKWKHIWTSTPHLIFDVHFFTSVLKEEVHEPLKFCSIMLISGFPIFQEMVLRDFSLWNAYMSPLKLSPRLFSCGDLEKLKLHFCIFRSPLNFEGFPKLTSLELDRVVLRYKTFKDLIDSCLVLEKLSLTNFTGLEHMNIVIDVPKLRYLTIDWLFGSIDVKSCVSFVWCTETGQCSQGVLR